MEGALQQLSQALETCWGLAAVSGIAGYGGGFGFGIFIATLQGGHGELADAPFREQVKQGFKRTAEQAWVRGRFFAKQFGAVGLVYAFIECNLSKTLGKHDMYHGLMAAALGGSMFALVPTLPTIRTAIPSSVARGMMMGAVGWTAFTLIMELGLRSMFFVSSYDVGYARTGQAGELYRTSPAALAARAEAESASVALAASGAGHAEREEEGVRGDRGLYGGSAYLSVDAPSPREPSLWHRLVHGSPHGMNRPTTLEGDGWVGKPF